MAVFITNTRGYSSRYRQTAPDRTLIAAVAQAHRWLEQLTSGEVGSTDQIAARDQVDASDVGRQIRLAFLAPDIVEAMLADTQPVELTTKRLKRLGHVPLDWEGQRRMLGFNPGTAQLCVSKFGTRTNAT